MNVNSQNTYCGLRIILRLGRWEDEFGKAIGVGLLRMHERCGSVFKIYKFVTHILTT